MDIDISCWLVQMWSYELNGNIETKCEEEGEDLTKKQEDKACSSFSMITKQQRTLSHFFDSNGQHVL